ncbi:MAG: hypothetical protein J6P60_00450, partial [Lachnospiraceae bacterium]|nr:hypothetical protein [Lachnospiraceae bacterium]
MGRTEVRFSDALFHCVQLPVWHTAAQDRVYKGGGGAGAGFFTEEKKAVLSAGILLNLGLLFFFKYFSFVAE